MKVRIVMEVEVSLGPNAPHEVEVYAPASGKVEMNLVTDPWSVSLSSCRHLNCAATIGVPGRPW